MLRSRVFFVFAALAAGCSGVITSSPGGGSSGGNGWTGGDDGSGPSGADGGSSASTPSKYPGHGFVVHEWGTDTIVVGSDGSMQRGLHHEEEDLPPFVYDRIKAGQEMSTYVKMETPVTYFYSDKPLSVSASVSFPHGIFSQWYPQVQRFTPGIAPAGAINFQPQVPASPADPFLDVRFPFSQAACSSRYESAILSGASEFDPPVGLLDWGTFDVLARGTAITPPDAPLDKYTWSFARNVASNPLRTQAGQVEQFLFYRGLGNFDLPVKVSLSKADDTLQLANSLPQATGPVFALNVGSDAGAFVERSAGIAPNVNDTMQWPSLAGAPSLDSYAKSLGDSMTKALASVGLYDDEAQAMVDTWKRQWFRTPGVRLLYVAPQSWTDASIPLAVQPAPDAVKRVMVIRVEVLTRDVEQADVAQAQLLSSAGTAAQAQAYFVALGRFAEPRLRRALAILGNPSYGDSLLAQVATANTTVSAGE